MRMIDTALESLDVLFFHDKIFGYYWGTTFLKKYRICGLEWNVLSNNSIEWMSFSGTMRTSMEPKIIRRGKYDI